ncbi:MAG: hypothetical protein NW241_00865 [Bacteroidia bacterium]|nr:hypothetical protein [Bacteroidia bacterium]
MKPLLLPALLLLAAACKPCEDWRNPECENYHPCDTLGPVSADFRMEEDYFLHKAPVANSIFMNRGLILTASQELDTYEWTIGTDTIRRRTRTTTVWFGFPAGRIDIRLVGTRPPDTLCYPGDDGRDTVWKTVWVEDRDSLPVWGEYEGYSLSNPKRPFTFRLQPEIHPWVGYTAMGYNLPEGCTRIFGVDFGGSGFEINGGAGEDGCRSISGYGFLSPDEQHLTVYYSTYNDAIGRYLADTFQAVRK